MRKLSNLIVCPKHKHPRPCDARITIDTNIVMIEYSNGLDLTMVRSHPKAVKLINFIKL